MLNDSGEFYNFEEFKQLYGIRGTILNYASLLRKIPQHWKLEISENKPFILQNRYNTCNNPYVVCLIKDRKGSRRFYDIFLGVNDVNAHSKWQSELGNINKEDWNNYNMVLNDINEIKLRDFQYKINNKILVTKSFLFKIKKIDSNLCVYCNEHSEKIDHLFLRCNKVKAFWNDLKNWLRCNCNISLSLEDKNIIFSYQTRKGIENYLLLLGKYYIYKNKFSEKELSIQSFVSLLRQRFLSGKYLANIHDKFGKFMQEWSRLYNYFTYS